MCCHRVDASTNNNRARIQGLTGYALGLSNPLARNITMQVYCGLIGSNVYIYVMYKKREVTSSVKLIINSNV